ncbi:MAG: hypothetical protein WCI77_10670 [Candidatus Omnitrophota bacterium]
MRKLLLAFLLTVLLPFNTFAIFRVIEKIEDVRIKRVAVSPFDDKVIYVGSKNALFISRDKGATFRKTYVFTDEEITHLFADQHLTDILYITTTRHFYRIKDNVERLYSAPEETIILSSAKYKENIYLGTSNGIYVADENVLKWRKISGLDAEVQVYFIEPSEKKLYLATSRGVYVLSDNDTLERVYVLRDKETSGEEESGVSANIVKIDIFNKDRVWLGTSRGIILSNDAGRTWEKLYIEGVDNLNIYSVAQTALEKDTLYVCGPKGFFKIDLANKRSTQIFEGLSSCEIFWLDFSNAGEIYLATSQGLFVNEYFTPPSKSASVEEMLSKEPSIAEIQQAALRYNEVHPDKIKKWRNALKFRGLFPTFNLDYDKTVSVYQSATVDRAYVGPRDWGASFSWNVGDLIWNTYEDDIDTRSRLNTQLRLDILDEINRVYFERLRIKREIAQASLSEEEFFQKNLRLQELTAIIDGYTGGYFSKKQELADGKH